MNSCDSPESCFRPQKSGFLPKSVKITCLKFLDTTHRGSTLLHPYHTLHDTCGAESWMNRRLKTFWNKESFRGVLSNTKYQIITIIWIANVQKWSSTDEIFLQHVHVWTHNRVISHFWWSCNARLASHPGMIILLCVLRWLSSQQLTNYLSLPWTPWPCAGSRHGRDLVGSRNWILDCWPRSDRSWSQTQAHYEQRSWQFCRQCLDDWSRITDGCKLTSHTVTQCKTAVKNIL